MNNQIDRIVEDAKQLPYDELKIISERLLDILDEMEWAMIVAKPPVKTHLEAQGRLAWQEHLEGESEEGGFGCL